jgi:Mitochondrial ribosomal protein subunit L20
MAPLRLPSSSSLSSVSYSALRPQSSVLSQLASIPASKRHVATRRRLVKRLNIQGAPSLKTHKVLRLENQINVPIGSHILFNPPPAAPNVFHTPLKFMPESDTRRQLLEHAALPSMYNFPTQTTDRNEISRETATELFNGGNAFKEAARALGYGRDSMTGAAIKTTEPFQASPITLPSTALHSIPKSYPVGLAPRVAKESMLPPLAYKARPEPKMLTQEQVNEIRGLRRERPDEWTIGKICKKYGCNFGIVRAIWASSEAGEKHEEHLTEVKQKWGRKRTVARLERKRRKALWEMDA